MNDTEEIELNNYSDDDEESVYSEEEENEVGEEVEDDGTENNIALVVYSDDEEEEEEENDIQNKKCELEEDEDEEENDVINDVDDDEEEDITYDDENECEDENDDEEEENKIKIIGGAITKSNKISNLIQEDDNEDDNEDDDDINDESYLQKLNADVNKNYISDFHPECLNNNYDEISALTIVVRDNNNNIIDNLHKTIPYLTKYEKARVLGQRAKQINSGAKVFVKIPENIIDGYLIAELELKEKKIPFIIRRPIPGGGCEYWNLRDLEIICF